MRLPPNPTPSSSAARSVARLVAAAGLIWAAIATPAAAADPTPVETTIVWVRFADRGPLESAGFAERRRVARAQLSARSWERRVRRTGSDAPLASDLPVANAYVRAVEAQGLTVRAVSRWLNAVSVAATPAELEQLARLPFVAGIEVVPRARRGPVEDWERTVREVPAESSTSGSETNPFPTQSDPGTPAFYGASYAQNRLIGADALHGLGLSGAGVLIAVLDTGFRETHAALSSLDVVARQDFINKDFVVSNEPGQDFMGYNQESHGTYTLSTIAGYLPGVHVGTAFAAQVALGKTEFGPSETPVEMDYWQMGAEWADSLGADVISSSLGYSQFDNPGDSYTYLDLDGETTVVTLAAAEAARRGITVVTAQGNAGNTSWHYLIAPADGDSVCAVGAVDSLGTIASFSSYGPSADGRVKPDVCAMGVSVQTVSVSNDNGYIRPNGTSFSTPATAGLVALLLEMHPTWGPFEVLEALRNTADRFFAPDDHYGYGVAQGVTASNWTPSTVAAPHPGPSGGPVLEVLAPVAGRQGLQFRLGAGERGGAARLDLHDVRGRLVERVWSGRLAAGETALLQWTNPRRRGHGIYWARLVTPDGETSRRATLLW